VGALSKELGVVVIADTRYWDEILQLYATVLYDVIGKLLHGLGERGVLHDDLRHVCLDDVHTS
jgi:hypothetical protein